MGYKSTLIARLEAGSKLVPTPHGPVEYATVGAGPSVLVSHGTPGGYDQGLVIAEMFGGARFQLVAVSRPGYLRTPLEVGKSPEEQADAFALLLDSLKISKAAVIGVSGGGPAALQFALRHPDRCWGLVLISAVTGWRPASQRPFAWRILHSIILGSDLLCMTCAFLISAIPKWATSRWGDPARSLIMKKMVTTLIPPSLRRTGHKNDSQQFATLPVYPLGQISCPTLVVHGAADGPVPWAHAEFAASTIPRAELVTLAKGGHGVFFTRAKDILPKVEAFLEAHAPPSDLGRAES